MEGTSQTAVSLLNFKTISKCCFRSRLRAVRLQSVESKLGRTGESELAERETGERREEASSPASPQLSLALLDFLG